MVSNKASPLGGTIIAVVIVVVLVPPVLLTETAEFRKEFMKKCKEFPMEEKTCTSALATLEKAFVGKDEETVTADDYEGLFKVVPLTHPGDKTMFWSGINKENTKDVVHRFTKTRDHFFTLEDTLLGHVLNELQWCGKANSKEIFMKDCRKDKPNAVFSFWLKASAKVAKHAHGDVTVMLDGERPEPYYDRSVFATVEVPNLSPGVKKLVVIVVVQNKGEKCNKDSLKNLSNIVKARKIAYECKEVLQAHIEKCITDEKTGSCW